MSSELKASAAGGRFEEAPIDAEEAFGEVDLALPRVQVLVICASRELYAASRWADGLAAGLRTACVCNVMQISRNREMLECKRPHVLVATSARALALVRSGALRLDGLGHLLLYGVTPSELRSDLALRRELRHFLPATAATPAAGATGAPAPAAAACAAGAAGAPPLVAEVSSPAVAAPAPAGGAEGAADDDGGPVPALAGVGGGDGVWQCCWVAEREEEKQMKLCHLLDALDFQQLIIFAQGPVRVASLERVLSDLGYPSLSVHEGHDDEARASQLRRFRGFEKRILVAEDALSQEVFGGGAGRTDAVVSYDLSVGSPEYARLLSHFRTAARCRGGCRLLAVAFTAASSESGEVPSLAAAAPLFSCRGDSSFDWAAAA